MLSNHWVLCFFATLCNVFSGRWTYSLTGTKVLKANHYFEDNFTWTAKSINTGYSIFSVSSIFEVFHFSVWPWLQGLTIVSKPPVLFCWYVKLLVSELRFQDVSIPFGIEWQMKELFSGLEKCSQLICIWLLILERISSTSVLQLKPVYGTPSTTFQRVFQIAFTYSSERTDFCVCRSMSTEIGQVWKRTIMILHVGIFFGKRQSFFHCIESSNGILLVSSAKKTMDELYCSVFP